MPSLVASSRASRSASLPLHRHDLVDQPFGDRLLGEARDEVGAPALHQVRPELRMAGRGLAGGVARLADAAAEHRRVVGLGGDHADARRRPPSGRAPRRAACRRCRSRRRRRGSARPAKSARISRAVVRVCTSALASLSNWRHRNQPCAAASSIALFSMPVPFSAAGVSTTRAPRKRSSLRRSTLKLSAIVTHQRVALLGAHHRQADAGVAAGRLDHRLARASARRCARRPR